MTLAQAKALRADVEYGPYRPDLDEKTLEALARYMQRFTPTVATETQDVADDESLRASVPSCLRAFLYLDLSGCEHLFGGLEAIVRQIGQSMHDLRIPTILGVGPTAGAAHAITFLPATDPKARTRIRMIIPRNEKAVEQAPLAGLRLPPEILESLHHLGLETIADLRALSRDALVPRFGNIVLQRMNQLQGTLAEPLIPLTWSTPIEARFDFDGSVADPMALEQVFRNLLGEVLPELERRGEGIRELEVTLARDPSWRKMNEAVLPAQFTLNVSRPSRDTKAILNLYRCAFEQLPLKAQKQSKSSLYSRNFDAGFTNLQIKVTRAQRLPHRQVALERANAPDEHGWQNTLDLIRTRLGENAIEQAQLQEAYVPEKAFKRIPASAHEAVEETERQVASSRPLHLLAPEELRVMSAPSHDADGVPLTFNFDGAVHRLIYAVGPERIAGQWWEGHTKTRDYFDVADDAGQRFWIFRVQETGKWYMHGTFE